MVGDELRLTLALSCLLTNFITHGGASARIFIRHADDDSVEMTFTDDGNGIQSDRRDAALEAFGVGSPLHRRTADGLGLGLPLTRRVVELHGGRFALEQTDSGLAARIQLPAWRFAQARAMG